MKTFFIDLDSLSHDTFKNLIGFVLTVGLKFRKIDLIKDEKSTSTMVIETETKGEEKGLHEFLKKNEVDSPITILSNNNATVGLKVIGKLKQLPIEKTSSVFYLDKSTGKRFVIV
jgi:hypothetical protein